MFVSNAKQTAAKKVVGRVVRSFVQAPPLVKVGGACGVLAGLSIGLMVSAPAGIVFGLSIGASIGIVAGIVMDRDAQRESYRHRQLDEIIGVTSGSLGAPPSIPPPPNAREHDEDEHGPKSSEADLRSWVTEWMTPPPPHVT